MRPFKVILAQLPIPQAAALAPTGNVPLAAGSLAVAARVHGVDGVADLELLPRGVTDSHGDAALADLLAGEAPQVLGLSLYLWNVERSLHLAREVKRRSPRTTIVIGGPEVGPDNPFVLAQEGFDLAVTGEAEDLFGSLLGVLIRGGDPGGLAGVAARSSGGLGAFGPPPRADFPLEDYPSPYLAGVLPVESERSTYLETVRGCRSHCTFCFYPRSSNSLRALSPQSSGDLVGRLGAAGARELVFLDPTFNHRPGFAELLGALATANPDARMRMFAEVRAEGLTAAHADGMARAGFTKLEIGLQSVNAEALRRSRRGGSPRLVAEAARLLHERGIRLLVDLMVGLPADAAADVARGVEFLEEHGLGDEAQVFPLAVLPGTALRADAEREGIEFDPAPPYLVRRTATMDEEEIRGAMAHAEKRLGRRLGAVPRPHLVGTDAPVEPPDVFVVDCDREPAGVGNVARPGAPHAALWVRGRDLWRKRERLRRVVEARMAVDPYCTLDVVLQPRAAFPLDLLDFLRGVLERGPPSYGTRVLSWRGEDTLRRIAVVLAPDVDISPDYLDDLLGTAPVYADQSLERAASTATRLGDGAPGARVVGPWPPDGERLWRCLAGAADPEWVAFADRGREARWTREVLGMSEVGE